MDNPQALAALMSIEGFRSLNKDIETIINKSEAVKKAKQDKKDKLTKKEKEELSDEEKKAKSMRKQVQEKLIKFATRIPVFMYLTDYRERSLTDVITQLEPGLFKKVTGLDVKDFELLCSLKLFNPTRMNDAIFKFKRYEDTSLSYTGIDRHADQAVGGWDTVIRREEYDRLFVSQQETMTSGLRTSSISEPIVAKPIEARRPIISEPIKKVVAPTSKPSTTPITPSAKPAPVVPEKPKAPEYIPPHVEVGTVVTHKIFGEGTITWVQQSKKYVYVKFVGKGDKTFVYPDAFKQGFLTVKE